MKQTAQEFLRNAGHARATAALDFGAGRSVTVWDNDDDRVQYDNTKGNTFSLYLDGGTGTRRLDAGAICGWPGAVCILPEGHRSEWVISSPQRFIHLHVPDDVLRAAYAVTHDCDARRLSLPDITFAAMPALAAPLMQLAIAASSDDRMLAETAMVEMIARLSVRKVKLNGGLAPQVLRRVDEWIEAHLEDTVSLSDLAQVAGLSDFHFHRMFRLSRGMSPHAWITSRRVDRARMMLQTATPLAEIAAACGFSSQSHLNRVFRQQTGRTPGSYRTALCQG